MAEMKSNKGRPALPEGLAVELYMDPVSERRALDLRKAVYAGGITPVLGLMNDRPHISLAVFPGIRPEKLIELTAAFAKKVSPLEFQLSAVGVFPTPDNVLFLYPVPTPQLLAIHAEYHFMLENAGILSGEYYRPGNWVPHCTLEIGITSTDLRKAVQICKKGMIPIRGMTASIGLVSFRPIEYLVQFQLEGN